VTTRRSFVGLLTVGLAGCAKADWIESTLVTVDVTGTWTGQVGLTGVLLELQLRQRGAVITGNLLSSGYQQGAARGEGPLEGEITGDVVRLRQTNGQWRFDLTVAGDEMTGSSAQLSVFRPISVTFRRSQ